MVEEVNVFDLIRDWSKAKGIDKAEPSKHMLKLIEKFVELSIAIQKNDQKEIEDAIGDSMVDLTILSQMYNVTVEKCVCDTYTVMAEKEKKSLNLRLKSLAVHLKDE